VFDDAETAAQLFELKQYGNIYTRIGNPTTAVLEERLASLEGATGAVATASGMAAQLVTFMTLLAPGDEIVASSHLYGGSLTQLTHSFKKLSLPVASWTRPGWKRGATPRTRALFERRSAIPEVSGHHRIPLIVDALRRPTLLADGMGRDDRPFRHQVHRRAGTVSAECSRSRASSITFATIAAPSPRITISGSTRPSATTAS
jgi:O-acetylhomoserine/O-acetylserine sulfhydrylase-like pyridoxal-dependent enzyme